MTSFKGKGANVEPEHSRVSLEKDVLKGDGVLGSVSGKLWTSGQEKVKLLDCVEHNSSDKLLPFPLMLEPGSGAL